MPTRRRSNDGVPTIEWVTGLVGLTIVVGTLAFIGYEAFQGGSEQPRLEAAVETTGTLQSGFSVTVVVRNASRRAAADVLVEGVVRARDGEHRSEVQLDYVAGLSSRRATLIFPTPSASDGITVRILGYTTP
jgi:uncharacterized protein (TIGR02588 family)